MSDRTEIHIEWDTRPAITLAVSRSRALSANEIRLVADVVDAIEELRTEVQANETVAL